MKTAFVSGGAGFIGRHLIPRLVEEGYSVLSIDPRHKKGICEDGQVKTVSGKVENWLPPKTFDLVVHLAANIVNVQSRSEMGIDAFADTVTDWTVCKWVEQHPPTEAFIAMSSCALDYDGDPYTHVKRNMEAFAKQLHKKGVPSLIFRPYSGYGEDQTTEYPFNAILRRCLERQDPVIVWGDGTQQRDFINVEDLIDAMVYGIKHFPRGVPIPLGTGKGTDFLTLAQMMAEEVGYSPEVKADPSKSGSSPKRICDTSIAEQYGWKAKIGLREGILRAIGYHTVPV